MLAFGHREIFTSLSCFRRNVASSAVAGYLASHERVHQGMFSGNAVFLRFHRLEREQQWIKQDRVRNYAARCPRLGFFLEVFDRHEEDSPGMNRTVLT